MRKKLIDLLDDFYSVSIIGMSKNAGKTTVLGKLIEQCQKKAIRVGLTSIGRDGEDVDIVTGTDKPRIFVAKDTIIATAADLVKKSDITKEIMRSTGINTPLGEVVFVNARSDGYVQIGGSSIGAQIMTLVDDFRELGAGKVFIDGALGRKTLVSPIVSEAALLCSGASFSPDISKVISETVFTAKLLMLPCLVDETALNIIDKLPESQGNIVLIDKSYCYYNVTLDNLKAGRDNIAYIYFRGALTERMMDKLIMSNVNLRGVYIIVQDGSKLFISEKNYDKLIKSGAGLLVKRSIKLVALTINPMSVSGYIFDKNVFLETVSERLDIPVYNVMDEEAD